jgi:hypothetical protein
VKADDRIDPGQHPFLDKVARSALNDFFGWLEEEADFTMNLASELAENFR